MTIPSHIKHWITACVLVTVTQSFSTASADVFELRTYTTKEGKLDALNARFRDHTIRLFKKQESNPWIPFTDEENPKTH